jgi:hypothetical protein
MRTICYNEFNLITERGTGMDGFQRNGISCDMFQIYNKIKDNEEVGTEHTDETLKAIVFDHVNGERIVLVDEISEVVVINDEVEPKKETVFISNDTMQKGYYLLKR